MYQGSCLCGKVKFTITNKVNDIVYCHCSLCRKAQGSAFATNGNIATNHFKFLSGEDNLTAYQYTDTRPEQTSFVKVILNEPRRGSTVQTKLFCSTCGSPIMSKNSSSPDIIRIRLGTIESDINESPEAHIFVSSKANWEEISDNLPQYDEYKPK